MCAIIMVAGREPSLRWLQIIPVFFLMTLFCSGIAFFAARMTIHVRDITQLIPFITRLIFYVSGLFYVIGDKFHGTKGAILKLNPLNVYISLVRDALLHEDVRRDGITVGLHTWEEAAIYGVVLFVAGFIFFWRAEGLYGRD
jgi:teichoic acid transport system permease protein